MAVVNAHINGLGFYGPGQNIETADQVLEAAQLSTGFADFFHLKKDFPVLKPNAGFRFVLMPEVSKAAAGLSIGKPAMFSMFNPDILLLGPVCRVGNGNPFKYVGTKTGFQTGGLFETKREGKVFAPINDMVQQDLNIQRLVSVTINVSQAVLHEARQKLDDHIAQTRNTLIRELLFNAFPKVGTIVENEIGSQNLDASRIGFVHSWVK